jgi:hypothetical protein
VLLCKNELEIQSIQVLAEVLHFEQSEAHGVQALGVTYSSGKNPSGHY